MASPDADPQSNPVHIDIDDGAISVDFSKDRLDAMSQEEKLGVAHALTGLAVNGELSAEELASLESVRPTVGLSNEDGRSEQFTSLGDGIVAQEHIAGQEKTSLERISEVLNDVSARQQEFLKEALARGMSEHEISDAAKKAVSKGALPRVVRAVGMRDGVSRISVIHGTEVPPQALTVDFSRAEDGGLESMSIQKSMMAPIPPSPVEGDPTGYHQEMFAIGPQVPEEDLVLAAARLESAIASPAP